MYVISMRNGIKACPKNWQNCTMWVQDCISPSTNITAEIPKPEVDNFIKMCQMFATHVPKLMINPKIQGDAPQASSSTLKNETISFNGDKKVLDLIQKEIPGDCVPKDLERRQCSEKTIISTLTQFIGKFDASLKLFPFGSSEYGIKWPNSNFNILVTISELSRFTNFFECFYIFFGINLIFIFH